MYNTLFLVGILGDLYWRCVGGREIQGAPRKKKKDWGLFFFKMGSGHGLSTYVSRHLSIYGNGTFISE